MRKGTVVDRPTFDGYVHEALAHVYDLPFLQRSPLVDLFGLRKRDGGGGTALHRTLIEAIEELKPPREVSPEAVAWKTYRSLQMRYVRSLNAAAAASELGLSTRQAQRVHFVALASISTYLWENSRAPDRDDAHVSAVSRSVEPLNGVGEDATLDAELAAILAGDHGELESFPLTVRGALATIGPMLQQRRIVAELTVDEALAHSIAPRGLVRQALVQIFLGALEWSTAERLDVSADVCPRGARLLVTVEPEAVPAREAKLALPLERRLRIAERLLSAIGGRLTASATPRIQISATLPLGIAPTVLTVEDNPQVVQLFRRYLNGSIYRFIHAPDADVAVELASEEQPNVITLDVMMPRRDGWELLQALKVRPDTQRIPVLVCSVLRDQELALALGAAEFLPKPVTQHALLSALNRYVREESGIRNC